MTPVGHYATSAVTGVVITRVTGSVFLGGLAAFCIHMPMDYCFNEFFQWGDDLSRKAMMFVFMLPAMGLLAFSTLNSSDWVPFLLFGLIGCMIDLFDTAMYALSGQRFLHWDTPVHMLSFTATVATETAFALLAFITTAFIL